MVRVKMAPDVEITMDVELEGIDGSSRDHDVQMHKKVVFDLFLERLKRAFPEEDVKIDTFCFGLETDKEKTPAAG